MPLYWPCVWLKASIWWKWENPKLILIADKAHLRKLVNWLLMISGVKAKGKRKSNNWIGINRALSWRLFDRVYTEDKRVVGASGW